MRRDAAAELGDVPLEERGDEIGSPREALVVGAGQERARKAASNEESPVTSHLELGDVEPRHLDVRDATCERLRCAADQIERCAAENQEARMPGRSIRENPEQRQQIGPPLELVEDHQTSERSQDSRAASARTGVAGSSRSKYTPLLPTAISLASVVLPHCLGPERRTMGARRSASSTEARRWRRATGATSLKMRCLS